MLKSDCSIRVYSIVSKILFNMVSVLLEYIKFIISSIIFSYYAGIVLDAFGYLLCSKLCWHNWLVPNKGPGSSDLLFTCSLLICSLLLKT